MQLTYTIEHAAGYEGMPASLDMNTEAGLNKSGAEIPFGRAVVLDTAAGRLSALTSPSSYLPVKLPSGAADKVLGVVLLDQAHNPTRADGSRSTGVLDGDMLSLIKQGKVYVKVEQAVDPSSPVFVRHTANGGGTAPGQFRIDADTANASALAGARFAGKAAAGGIVAVDLNLP